MTTPIPNDGAIPTGETPAAPTGSGTTTPASVAPVAMTREELDRQLADARRSGERSARDSDETKALRAKAKRLDDLEEQNKTEAEKLAADRDRHKSEADGLRNKYRAALIRSAFTTKALEAGIPADRIDHAYRLADTSGVTVDEDTDAVRGIADALKAVPDWVKAAEPVGTGGRRLAPNINHTGGVNGQGAGMTREAAIEQEKQRLAGTGRYT